MPEVRAETARIGARLSEEERAKQSAKEGASDVESADTVVRTAPHNTSKAQVVAEGPAAAICHQTRLRLVATQNTKASNKACCARGR